MRLAAGCSRIKRQLTVYGYDELAIQHESLLLQRTQMRQHLRKKARQRLAGLGLDFHLRAGLEGKTPEAVPLGLELPPAIFGQLGGQA
jgi:hypothetical protein